jgi:hypothetical protein
MFMVDSMGMDSTQSNYYNKQVLSNTDSGYGHHVQTILQWRTGLRKFHQPPGPPSLDCSMPILAFYSGGTVAKTGHQPPCLKQPFGSLVHHCKIKVI